MYLRNLDVNNTVAYETESGTNWSHNVVNARSGEIRAQRLQRPLRCSFTGFLVEDVERHFFFMSAYGL